MQTATGPQSRWLTLGVVGLGIAIGPLDSAVNIAFPAITKAFAIPLPAIQWVIICYVLTYASLLLGCGRLGDVVGHRRVYVLGLGWSVISLLLCALAPTFGWFLLFRGLQGLGTALVLSCGPALATLPFPEDERGKLLGFYNMLYAVAYTLGPLVGGYLVARWGWSAVFWFRAPLALLSAGLMLGLIRQPIAVQPGQRFDILGAVTLALALAGTMFAFNQAQHHGWLALPSVSLFVAACVCLAVFIRHEVRCAEPVIDLRLFGSARFSLANTVHVLAHMASFTILLLVPYYLLNYYHAAAGVGGLLLALSPLGSVLASPVSGWLLTRYTAQHLSLCGLLLIVAGTGGISLWQATSTAPLIAVTLVVQGIGLGLFQVANMDFVMGGIPRSQQGVAGSLTVVTRTIGVVGCATMASLLLGSLQSYYTLQLQATGMAEAAIDTQAFMLAFQWVFRGAAVVALVAAGLMWVSRLTPQRT